MIHICTELAITTGLCADESLALGQVTVEIQRQYLNISPLVWGAKAAELMITVRCDLKRKNPAVGKINCCLPKYLPCGCL